MTGIQMQKYIFLGKRTDTEYNIGTNNIHKDH